MILYLSNTSNISRLIFRNYLFTVKTACNLKDHFTRSGWLFHYEIIAFSQCRIYIPIPIEYWVLLIINRK